MRSARHSLAGAHLHLYLLQHDARLIPTAIHGAFRTPSSNLRVDGVPVLRERTKAAVFPATRLRLEAFAPVGDLADKGLNRGEVRVHGEDFRRGGRPAAEGQIARRGRA